MIAKAVGCLTNGFMTVVCAFPANGKRNARYIIFGSYIPPDPKPGGYNLCL